MSGGDLLGAARKVSYACTHHDAAEIGLDDNFIYEQPPLEMAQRSQPMEQVARETSFGLFRESSDKPDKPVC
ncbi:MAG: hypothetical protein H0X34_13525 [Chthoniobacterales bacterium]|nr:hypothetical protein [Chthoniobacterales bacterium]